MPSLSVLEPKFSSYVEGLSAEETARYEGLPNHVKFLRKIVLAWSKADLENAIRESNGGDTVSSKTISNIEDKESKGSEKSFRRILSGFNKGLTDRKYQSVTFDEVFPKVK